MAIDPMRCEKPSGRKGDVYTRMGAALAKDARAKPERDAMPKGVSVGLKTTMMPGIWAQLFNWFRDRNRLKG